MALCATCRQPIREAVVAGRKLIAQVHPGARAPAAVGRYLTILDVTCGCGSRTVRRYENLPLLDRVSA
jgi:hypothetical protein